MGFGSALSTEVRSLGVLAIIIVIVSVILLKLKDVDGVTTGLNSTIDTFVTGLSEPKNWVIIIVVGVVGFALLKLFNNKDD